ncbi:GNAT family N-acetyltransferase [Rubrobacter calidifluminis]|uniref:GNAT family N-acetyltransferase n=1 Tax=Rubrobacter calidifluminis TaxID=1392640 RepID=UPI002362A276|nr:GNAT family protein [Rubrobacter calidifluminis]
MRLIRRPRKLTGERVELRHHSRRHYPLYGEWYADEEIWNLTSWAPAPLTRRESERLFRDREASPTEESFAIHVRGEDEPIGIISLVNINRTKGSADLSVMLGPPESRGKGYGPEAIGLLLDHAFGTLRLERVGLSVFEFNERAISAYRKLGFHEDGRMNRAVRRGERLHDAILMSLSKVEWEQRKERGNPEEERGRETP